MAIDAWLTLLQAAQSASTRSLWRASLDRLGGSAEALLAEPAHLLHARGLPADAVAKLETPDIEVTQRWQQWLSRPQSALVPLGSAHYPPQLAATPDAPLALWVESPDLALLAGPQLAIVGSRSPTTDGRATAERFAKYFAERGLTVTSGLATGIDGASHQGALHELGGTIAVLGCGIDVVFPRSHGALAAAIAARGALVSEYGPGVAPQKHFFPERNRIIAGLTLGTLIVEATRRSGSLITARLAMEYGREVFAIPGSIHNPLARGCHWLIRQGAKLVEEAHDVFVELLPQLQSLGIDTPIPEARSALDTGSHHTDPSYQKLLAALGFSPVSITELGPRTDLTIAELSSMLLVLELEGLVEALPGGRYSRLGKQQ